MLCQGATDIQPKEHERPVLFWGGGQFTRFSSVVRQGRAEASFALAGMGLGGIRGTGEEIHMEAC